MLCTILHPILLISCQCWSWLKPWVTQETPIRGRSRKVRIVLARYLPFSLLSPSSRPISKPLNSCFFSIGHSPFPDKWLPCWTATSLPSTWVGLVEPLPPYLIMHLQSCNRISSISNKSNFSFRCRACRQVPSMRGRVLQG
jgi:hypothetical protein